MNLNIPPISRIELFREGAPMGLGITEKITIIKPRLLKKIRDLLNQEVEQIPFFPSGPGGLPTHWINVFPADNSKPF